jgi:hypothetical protein
MLVRSDWRLSGGPEIGPVGWGDVSYELAYYDSAGARTLLVRLPHLSRFGIFGRPASKEARFQRFPDGPGWIRTSDRRIMSPLL